MTDARDEWQSTPDSETDADMAQRPPERPLEPQEEHQPVAQGALASNTKEDKFRSVLLADIGSTSTHVCLIDLVEGRYRFVAHAEYPTLLGQVGRDLTDGVLRSVEQIEQVAQRDLTDGDGIIVPERPSGAGVDLFMAVSSAAPPLECLIVGLTSDLSLESARRACSGSHALVRHTITLGRRARHWDNRALALLRDSPPDVLVLVGGTDAGPFTPLESAAQVLATVYQDIAPERRPAVIFAGNQEARRPVSAFLAAMFDFRVVDNVRPDVRTETLGELQRELEAVYTQAKLASLPGYRRLVRWCSAPIISTTEALSTTWRFMAERNRLSQGILGIDIGGATTYAGAAHSSIYQWTTGAALGTSYGLDHLIDSSGLRDIARWLPISMPVEELSNRLENARLRPLGIPATMEDMFITQALARQAALITMRRMRRQHWHRLDIAPGEDTTPAFDVIAARGGSLTHIPQDGVLVLTLLDAIQPTGLARLVVDWAAIWPQLGALARVAPLAAAQVLEHDSFREIGTIIAPIGEARDGERALHIKITPQDRAPTETVVPAGTIRCFPLASDEEAIIEVRPSRAFDIGLGQKGVGGKATVRGGSLGIIVDTRGRPLSLPQEDEIRRVKMQEWLGKLINEATND